MELPVLEMGSVYHIGTLRQDDRGNRFKSSLEGHCLSVSHCPQAWARIARLGGRPLWRLEKPRATFLDMHKVARSKRLRAHIEAWGCLSGLVERKMLWRAWQYDCETEDWGFSLHGSEAEARREVEVDGDGPRGQAVEPVAMLTGTERLAQRVRYAGLEADDAFDFLAMVWAEDTQPQLDGVWWQEQFAPESLSAPRGGIFPGKVTGWRTIGANMAEVGDELYGKLKARRQVATPHS